MRKVLLILLLISLPGCQPGKESPARSTALREVKRLIDQDSFPAKYIIMYEEPSNDIGSIYKITPANSPFVEWSLERPEKVIKYKDRYICLMNPMESIDMPKEKLIEITDYPNDTTTGPVYDEIWYIGVSKMGRNTPWFLHIDLISPIVIILFLSSWNIHSKIMIRPIYHALYWLHIF